MRKTFSVAAVSENGAAPADERSGHLFRALRLQRMAALK